MTAPLHPIKLDSDARAFSLRNRASQGLDQCLDVAKNNGRRSWSCKDCGKRLPVPRIHANMIALGDITGKSIARWSKTASRIGGRVSCSPTKIKWESLALVSSPLGGIHRLKPLGPSFEATMSPQVLIGSLQYTGLDEGMNSCKPLRQALFLGKR